MGPRGRVLALAQGKAGFTVGEEKGVEDKAGKSRTQPSEPQQDPIPLHRDGVGEPHSHMDRDRHPVSPSPKAHTVWPWTVLFPALGLPD